MENKFLLEVGAKDSKKRFLDVKQRSLETLRK